MPFQEPVQTVVSLLTGELAGASRRYQKRIRDLDGLYLDQPAFASLAASRREEVAYEVYEFRPNENPGDLIFGTSILYPGKVGDEYFMTRGHIHPKSDRPEIYYRQSGSGVMLMETHPGETRSVAMKPQTVVYVSPHWIHRSVNTVLIAACLHFKRQIQGGFRLEDIPAEVVPKMRQATDAICGF